MVFAALAGIAPDPAFPEVALGALGEPAPAAAGTLEACTAAGAVFDAPATAEPDFDDPAAFTPELEDDAPLTAEPDFDDPVALTPDLEGAGPPLAAKDRLLEPKPDLEAPVTAGALELCGAGPPEVEPTLDAFPDATGELL